MSCAACASRLEGRLRRVPGVLWAGVNFATRRASVEPGSAGVAELVRAAEEAGFGAVLRSGAMDSGRRKDVGAPAGEDESKALLGRVVAGGLLALPVAVMAMSHGSIPWLAGAWTL